MEELTTAQREVNGQVAMLIKIFQIGGNSDHGDRVRETMMGESLQVCPVKLLFKDHKKWDVTSETAPPTRHVAGGHRGLNLHISEIILDLLEPLVGTIKGGKELISTEDFIAKVELLNCKMMGWTRSSMWHVGSVRDLRTTLGRRTPQNCAAAYVKRTQEGRLESQHSL